MLPIPRSAMTLENVYADPERASAYARLDFPGTYYLAYRDLPELLARHASGQRALDFGCGTGRSTRFLEALGFQAVGVDVAEEMVRHARARDPQGDYRVIGPGSLRRLPPSAWDLVLSAFTFDNVPQVSKPALMRDLAALLAPRGLFVNLVSAPEIYRREWASFSTRAFPENRAAKSGDLVRIVITDTSDPRPVEDVLCTDADYRALYEQAGLELVATHRPLGRPDERYPWVNETHISPWVIYRLRQASQPPSSAPEVHRGGFGDSPSTPPARPGLP